MKKIILSAFILLSVCGDVSSQNVGIGTATPQARLEVNGETNFSSKNNLILKNLRGDTLLRMRNDGNLGIGFNGLNYGRTVNIGGNGANFYLDNQNFGGSSFP